MRNKIHDQTKTYIEALKEHSVVMAYEKAYEEFNQDSEAKKLLEDFNDAQQTYAVFVNGQFPGATAQSQKVQELHVRVKSNKKIQELIKTQRDMQSLVADLSIEISKGINFPFTQPQSGGCCG